MPLIDTDTTRENRTPLNVTIPLTKERALADVELDYAVEYLTQQICENREHEITFIIAQYRLCVAPKLTQAVVYSVRKVVLLCHPCRRSTWQQQSLTSKLCSKPETSKLPLCSMHSKNYGIEKYLNSSGYKSDEI